MTALLTRRLLATALLSALSLPALAGTPQFSGFGRGIGSVTTPDASTTNVTITTANQATGGKASVLFWNNFDVPNGESVNFANQTNNPLAVINLVNSGSASQINGAINAPAVNGNHTSVLIVNPQGVNIGASAVINTSGAFIAAAGSVTPEGINPSAPAGAVAINLSQKAFITIDGNAKITTGDSQGAGVGSIAFLGYGPFSQGGQTANGNPLTVNTAALPYINDTDVSPWNFYANTPGIGQNNYYLAGFSLAGSSAVYQFNGHQSTMLDMGQSIPDIDAYLTGTAGTAHTLFQGNANLGNTTFQTAYGDTGGLNISASGILGGRFVLPDGAYDPSTSTPAVSSFNLITSGDLDGNVITSTAGGGALNQNGLSGISNTIQVGGSWRNSIANFNGSLNTNLTVGQSIDGLTLNSSLQPNQAVNLAVGGNVDGLVYTGYSNGGALNLTLTNYMDGTGLTGNVTRSTLTEAGQLQLTANNISDSAITAQSMRVYAPMYGFSGGGKVVRSQFTSTGADFSQIQGASFTDSSFASPQGTLAVYTSLWQGNTATGASLDLEGDTFTGGSAQATQTLNLSSATVDGMVLGSAGTASVSAYQSLTHTQLTTGADGNALYLGQSGAQDLTYTGGQLDVWGQGMVSFMAAYRPVGQTLVQQSTFTDTTGGGLAFHHIDLKGVTASTTGALTADGVQTVQGSVLTGGQYVGSWGQVQGSTLNLNNSDASDTDPAFNLITVSSLTDSQVHATGALDIEGDQTDLLIHNSHIQNALDNNLAINNANGSLTFTGASTVRAGNGFNAKALTGFNFGTDGSATTAQAGGYIYVEADTISTGAGSLLQILQPSAQNYNTSVFASTGDQGAATVAGTAVFKADNTIYVPDGAQVDTGAQFQGTRAPSSTAGNDPTLGILLLSTSALNLAGTLDASTPVVTPPSNPGDGGTPPNGGHEVPPPNDGTPVPPSTPNQGETTPPDQGGTAPTTPPSDGGIPPVTPPGDGTAPAPRVPQIVITTLKPQAVGVWTGGEVKADADGNAPERASRVTVHQE